MSRNKIIDITGNDYNELHVIGLHHVEKGRSYWTCQCKCGKIVVLRKDHFAYNWSKQKSCGCYHRRESSKRMLEYLKRKRQGKTLYK